MPWGGGTRWGGRSPYVVAWTSRETLSSWANRRRWRRVRVWTTSSAPPPPLADVRTACVSPGSSTKSRGRIRSCGVRRLLAMAVTAMCRPLTRAGTGEWPKTGFSPRKAQLSLYGLKDLPEGAALLPSLGRYTEGAGCVYVKKLDDIDLDVLRRLIAIAWSRGDDPQSAPRGLTRTPPTVVAPGCWRTRSPLLTPWSPPRRCTGLRDARASAHRGAGRRRRGRW